jgi:hypothetical protein
MPRKAQSRVDEVGSKEIDDVAVDETVGESPLAGCEVGKRFARRIDQSSLYQGRQMRYK